MTKNFADFEYEDKSSKQKKKKQKYENAKEEDLKRAYNELKDLDQNSLAARLAEEVKRQKESGTFNFELLSQSVESMRMFLPQESYLSLKNLLENIK